MSTQEHSQFASIHPSRTLALAHTMEGTRWVAKKHSFEGYTFHYECEQEESEENTNNNSLAVVETRTTKVHFDFEFVIPNPHEGMEEVLVQDLPKVEFGILHRLATVTGLDSCDFQLQLTDPWLRNTNGDQVPTVMSEENWVVGLSSFEPDVPSPIGT